MTQIFEGTVALALVDDDEVYRHYLVALVEVLQATPIDCIVLDYDLGSETAFALKERLDERFPRLPPIVMLTGVGRERTVVKALRLGISDYVPKRDLKIDELVSAITRVVGRRRHEETDKADHLRLTQASLLDSVTPLFGRAYLDDRVTQLAALSSHARASYGLVFVQMPELTQINENFGLQVGDRALRAFAERLRGLTRSSDVCGRYAGGTFLCIIEANSDAGLLEEFCRRLAKDLQFRIDLDAASVNLSARVGGTLCGAAVHTSADDLVGLARQALQESEASAISSHVLAPPASTTASEGLAFEAAPNRVSRPAGDALRASDRRKEPRQRVFKRGQIILKRESVADCTVRNISVHGACLRLATSFAVPDEFDFTIVGSGTTRRVRVRWRLDRRNQRLRDPRDRRTHTAWPASPAKASFYR